MTVSTILAGKGREVVSVEPSASLADAVRLLAGKPWLRVLCPACGQVGNINLAKVVRPPDTPIGAIYDVANCTTGICRGDAPPPVPLGLYAGKDDPVGELRQAEAERKLRG